VPPPSLRALRFAAGRAYADLWRALHDALWRVAPGSERRARTLPRLPPAPVHRKYGLRVGQPVDRVYIERFLSAHAADVRGRVLEILDPVYARRYGGAAVTRVDVLDLDAGNPQATIVGDFVTGAGVPRDAFDCFICTQTLSLIHDVRAAVDGAWRLLAPGGVLLLTVPGISQQADPDAEAFPDHWRFTKRAVAQLLADRFGAEHVEVGAEGTVAASAAFLYGLPADAVDPALLDPHDPDYEMVVYARAQKAI
jgi:SAM-dependent methyltransferase